MRKLALLLMVTVLVVSCATKEPLQFAKIFSDNMVLQQNEQVNIFGFATPNSKLTLQCSWIEAPVSVKTDKSGRWITYVQTPAGSFVPQQIMISNADTTISLNNILLGEVWIGSGQSNMEMTLAGLPATNLIPENSTIEITTAKNPHIRFITVGRKEAYEPQKDIIAGSWNELTPENAGGLSAVCHFFAKELFAKLNVPIGIVVDSYGGSPIESWIPIEVAQQDSVTYRSQIETLNEDIAASKQSEEIYVANMKEWIEKSQGAQTEKFVTEFDFQKALPINCPVNYENIAEVDASGGFLLAHKINISTPDSITIYPGMIDDMGEVFFNGKKVWSELRNSRSYSRPAITIPASEVKNGDNMLVINIINMLWGGGVGGSADDIYYTVGASDQKENIANNWRWTKLFDGSKVAKMPKEGKPLFNHLSSLYNGMIHPVKDFTFRGALWYQGEANVGTDRYPKMMVDMITVWRSFWGADMPFYYVQIAPWKYWGDQGQKLRAAQESVLDLIDNVGMAVTIDLGHPADIHPAEKKEVGERLALLALENTYSISEIESQSPRVQLVTAQNNEINITFSNTYGAMSFNSAEQLLEISADGANFVPANGKIKGDILTVSANGVEKPKFVRYAWSATPDGTLYNSANLPCGSFSVEANN